MENLMPYVEFEVWCATCGAGLCNKTTTRQGGIEVEACKSCLENARQEIREDLESQIDNLQSQLQDAQEQIEELEEQVHELNEGNL
jgi:peptidoglycan hydrolase CwlO-like protein